MNTISHNEMEPTGIFMITSDVHLEDAGFYKFSSNGLLFSNIINNTNINEDNSSVAIYSERYNEKENKTELVTELNIRRQYGIRTGNYFYVGITYHNGSSNMLHNGIYDISEYYRNLTILKAPKYNYSRPDPTSTTGYEEYYIPFNFTITWLL